MQNVIHFALSPPLPQTRILHVCAESGQEALSTAVLHGKGNMLISVKILGISEILWKLHRPLILSVINQNPGMQSVFIHLEPRG